MIYEKIITLGRSEAKQRQFGGVYGRWSGAFLGAFVQRLYGRVLYSFFFLSC